MNLDKTRLEKLRLMGKRVKGRTIPETSLEMIFFSLIKKFAITIRETRICRMAPCAEAKIIRMS